AHDPHAAAPTAAAAARTLPVQERHPPGRTVAADAAGALAARARAQPLPAHGTAAAPAGRGRLAGDTDCNCLTTKLAHLSAAISGSPSSFTPPTHCLTGHNHESLH